MIEGQCGLKTMNFLDSRSMSLVEFRPSGQPPGDYRIRYPMDMERYAFTARDEVNEAPQAYGWAFPGNPFEPPSEEAIFAGPYLLFSFRLDRKSVSPRLVKYRSDREAQRLMEERGVERLSRREKREIRERIHAFLLKQTLPSIRIFDVAWNLEDGRVLFTGTGQSSCTLFMELFERTFGMALVRDTLKSRTERALRDRAVSRSERKTA